MDPDQTSPIGAVYSGSTLFSSILKLSVTLGNNLQQTTSLDDIFRCIFFLFFPYSLYMSVINFTKLSVYSKCHCECDSPPYWSVSLELLHVKRSHKNNANLTNGLVKV